MFSCDNSPFISKINWAEDIFMEMEKMLYFAGLSSETLNQSHDNPLDLF